MSLTKVSYSMINGAAVNVNDFGAAGDGTTDDTTKIQAALVYAFANNKNLVFGTGQTYLISAALIIPQYQNLTYRGIEIDGKFCFIKRNGDFAAFTSGYTNSGTLTTNYGTTLDSHYSQGIRFKNFNFISSTQLNVAALKLQDWHQGCQVSSMTFTACNVAMQSNNSYYTTFDSLQSNGGDGSLPMFQWLGNINLNRVTNCVAVNLGGTGYSFSGGVTALTFTGNSIEGVAIGVIFNNAVYDVTLENNYAEGFTNTVVKFNDYVYNAILRNNYVNFQNAGTNYFIDYLPSPINNIVIEQSNYYNEMTSVAQVIKTLNSTANQSALRVDAYSGFTPNQLVDNTKISSKIDWREIQNFTSGGKAHVVNAYAVGNYSGKFSEGLSAACGFTDSSVGSNMYLVTNIKSSTTQRIYVNLAVNLSGIGFIYIKGEFIGTTFYEFTGAGLVLSTTLSIIVPGSTVQINGAMAAAISTAVLGEVRLI